MEDNKQENREAISIQKVGDGFIVSRPTTGKQRVAMTLQQVRKVCKEFAEEIYDDLKGRREAPVPVVEEELPSFPEEEESDAGDTNP